MANQTSTKNGAAKDCHVTGQNSEGMEFRGELLKLTRLTVVFEMHNPSAVLRFSESLSEFKVTYNGRELYAGKAVVRNLMTTGLSVIVCEATLNENCWSLSEPGDGRRVDYQGFLNEWQRQCRILPDFKIVMADLQDYLRDLQLWLNSIELSVSASAASSRAEQERQIIDELSGPVTRSIDVFVDRFEGLVAELDEEMTAIHQGYLRRQLHPYLLCSPFAHRAYFKPLGYAGDYEMVGMMLRPPYEGGSLFARIINFWLISQYPATAHRNRIDYLVRQLVEFTLPRSANQGPPPRILTVGCGPAQEVQRFLTDHHLSSKADITLLDFNEETLRYTGAVLAELKARHSRATTLRYIKKSVHHLLKEGGRNEGPADGLRYDFIYCAGLFDYLSNQVCKRLMNAFYDMLEPGGLLIATNVSATMNSTRPFRYSMEYMLDWHLIYRDAREMAELTPDAAAADDVAIVTEHIGVNIFIEVRKPDHA